MKADLLRVTVITVMAMAASVAWAQSPVESVPPAKSGPGEYQGLRVKQINPPATPTPFPLGVSAGRRDALEFRAPEQMTQADRQLVEANQAEIVQRADLQGFRLGHADLAASSEEGSWGYEQAVCPVFPDHVILEYSRRNGPGDVTLFSAVVPRGTGHVRVIPVQRRSYSLWTPAGANAITLNDFNHIVKEEGRGLSPDWLSLGLCYAALAGGHVRAALLVTDPELEKYPLARPATLLVSQKGGAVVWFSDAQPGTAPGLAQHDWEMKFAQNGRLLKVKHHAADVLTKRLAAGAAMEVKSTPVAGQVVDVPPAAAK